MPAKSETRTEYAVACSHGTSAAYASEAGARRHAKALDAEQHPCGPHRVLRRTITEEDVPDAE